MPSFITTLAQKVRHPRRSSPAPSQEDSSPEESLLRSYLTQNPQSTLEVLVLGAPNTGKRSLCERFTTDTFTHERDPTQTGQHRRLLELFPKSSVDAKAPADPKCQVLLDLTLLGDASNTHPGIVRQMVQDNEAYLLVYSVTDRSSFEAVEGLWRKHVRVGARSLKAPLFLVANCTDAAQEQRVVTEAEGAELAKKLRAELWPVSAKTGIGCGQGEVSALAQKVLLRRLQRQRT